MKTKFWKGPTGVHPEFGSVHLDKKLELTDEQAKQYRAYLGDKEEKKEEEESENPKSSKKR